MFQWLLCWLSSVQLYSWRRKEIVCWRCCCGRRYPSRGSWLKSQLLRCLVDQFAEEVDFFLNWYNVIHANNGRWPYERTSFIPLLQPYNPSILLFDQQRDQGGSRWRQMGWRVGENGRWPNCRSASVGMAWMSSSCQLHLSFVHVAWMKKLDCAKCKNTLTVLYWMFNNGRSSWPKRIRERRLRLTRPQTNLS